MFPSNSKNIQLYLDGIPAESYSSFDRLLADYLSGAMKETLESFGMHRISIHIGWLDNYRSIDTEGRFGKYYINLQIEPDSFSLAFYEGGPDEYEDYPLLSPDQPYAAVKHLTEELS